MYVETVKSQFDGVTTDLEGYLLPEVSPGDAATYPYVPAPTYDPFYSAPVPMTVDEPYKQTPIINDTTEPTQIKTSSYTINGTVVDSKGRAIDGVTMAFRLIGESSDTGSPEPLAGNSYGIEIEYTELKNYEAIFRAKGYITHAIALDILIEMPTVTLTENKNIPIWAILAVAAAVIIYRKKRKKVGAFNMGDLLPIALILGGVLAFDVIKRILEALGLWDSKDTKELDDVSSDPSSAWNPNFWKQKPSNVAWTYAITTTQALQYAKEIYDSFGAFDDCEECAKGVFRQLRTKANVSFLADNFQQKYGKDLLDFLRGGLWPKDRLSDADVAEINRYIQQLPNY